MIPTTWITLDHLPLTPNGKLDRTALPDPPPHQPTTHHPDPTDHTTQQIRTIWQDILHIEHIQPDDDLFDLGGDSLTAARIVARVHQQLGVNVPVEVFYESPTVTDLVAAIERISGAALAGTT